MVFFIILGVLSIAAIALCAVRLRRAIRNEDGDRTFAYAMCGMVFVIGAVGFAAGFVVNLMGYLYPTYHVLNSLLPR